MILNDRQKYLQVALNRTLGEAYRVVATLPNNPRIIVEAGTPLIKRYGIGVVGNLKSAWRARWGWGSDLYVVADLKTMDRGLTEVAMAKEAGAGAVVALGQAPVETVVSFVESCKKLGVDSMVDMMNVDQPIKIIRKWRVKPDVIILHRGVDEEQFNPDKPIPYVQINKIRSSYETMIAIAGGDTIREVQRAVFNDADIVVVWKDLNLVEEFLKEIK